MSAYFLPYRAIESYDREHKPKLGSYFPVATTMLHPFVISCNGKHAGCLSPVHHAIKTYRSQPRVRARHPAYYPQ